nr:ultraviolet-B receptor UVR8 [Tanacetum cinerariifolium]
TPTALAGAVYTQVVAGYHFSLGLQADGSAYGWGENTEGQVGDGTAGQKLVPTAVAGGHAFTQLAAGFYHSLGLRADGTVLAWGRNTYGQ